MVRALAPFRQHCSACNWQSRVITGHSDAIFISDFGSDIRATCRNAGKVESRILKRFLILGQQHHA